MVEVHGGEQPRQVSRHTRQGCRDTYHQPRSLAWMLRQRPPRIQRSCCSRTGTGVVSGHIFVRQSDIGHMRGDYRRLAGLVDDLGLVDQLTSEMMLWG